MSDEKKRWEPKVRSFNKFRGRNIIRQFGEQKIRDTQGKIADKVSVAFLCADLQGQIGCQAIMIDLVVNSANTLFHKLNDCGRINVREFQAMRQIGTYSMFRILHTLAAGYRQYLEVDRLDLNPLKNEQYQQLILLQRLLSRLMEIESDLGELDIIDLCRNKNFRFAKPFKESCEEVLNNAVLSNATGKDQFNNNYVLEIEQLFDGVVLTLNSFELSFARLKRIESLMLNGHSPEGQGYRLFFELIRNLKSGGGEVNSDVVSDLFLSFHGYNVQPSSYTKVVEFIKFQNEHDLLHFLIDAVEMSIDRKLIEKCELAPRIWNPLLIAMLNEYRTLGNHEMKLAYFYDEEQCTLETKHALARLSKLLKVPLVKSEVKSIEQGGKVEYIPTKYLFALFDNLS
jgi:hypothetical protein